MKISCCLRLAALTLMASPVWAEESLLWKASNPLAPQVVPAYAGQGSPFPVKAPTPEEVSATEVMDEQARLRDEALSYAQGLLQGNMALQPELRTLRIGGTLVGAQGARVLVNNDWIGLGNNVKVRQVKTREAVSALKALAEYDPSAAEQLNGSLNARLSSQPVVALKVLRITSTSVVLETPRGPATIPIPANP